MISLSLAHVTGTALALAHVAGPHRPAPHKQDNYLSALPRGANHNQYDHHHAMKLPAGQPVFLPASDESVAL
jgi:hypothetical protein